MRRHHLPFRSADRPLFESLLDGRKKVETRAGSPAYLKIEPGDYLVFTSGQDRVEKKVLTVRHYPSVGQLLTEITWSEIMPLAKSPQEVEAIYNSFPGYKGRLQKFGILAFELA